MEGTGNLMAVMDAMGHEKIDTTRLYNHPGTKQIRDAIERRNQLVRVKLLRANRLAGSESLPGAGCGESRLRIYTGSSSSSICSASDFSSTWRITGNPEVIPADPIRH